MSGTYNRGRYLLPGGSWVDGASVIRALLLDTSYTFDKDHDWVSDVVADEFDGTYTRPTVTGLTVTGPDDTNDVAAITFDPIVVTVAAGTTDVAGLILYLFGTGDGDSALLAYWNDVATFPFTATGASESFTPDAAGAVLLA